MKNLNQTIIVEEILSILTRKDNQNLLQICSDKFGIENDKQYKETITLLLDMEIISPVTRHYHKLTAIGRKVINMGGWEKYLEQDEKSKSEEAQIKQKEKDKLNYETRIAKWQVKTFWYFFVIAIVGAICGIISLIRQLI